MGGKKPGPTCTTHVGREWIDGGTLCRTRSGPSGPLGMALSLVMGASPVEEDPLEKWRREKKKEDALQRESDETDLGADIVLIAESPFGKSPDGQKIVKELRAYLASGNIVYGGTIDDGRADWDGQTIRLNDSYRGKTLQTIVELVHEGSHVTWRKAHPRPTDPEALKKDDVDDEKLARKNQLAVYRYYRETMSLPPDGELEGRLQRTGGHSGG